MRIQETPYQHTPSQRNQKTNLILDISAATLIVTGIASAALYKAQYAVPVIAAATVGTCTFIATLMPERRIKDAEAPEAAFNSLWASIFSGLITGVATTFCTWEPLINFVSTSPTAKLAGPLGAGMIACGTSLWIASSCLKRKNTNFYWPCDDDL